MLLVFIIDWIVSYSLFLCFLNHVSHFGLFFVCLLFLQLSIFVFKWNQVVVVGITFTLFWCMFSCVWIDRFVWVHLLFSCFPDELIAYVLGMIVSKTPARWSQRFNTIKILIFLYGFQDFWPYTTWNHDMSRRKVHLSADIKIYQPFFNFLKIFKICKIVIFVLWNFALILPMIQSDFCRYFATR